MDSYFLDLAKARLAGAFLLAETGRLLLVATAFLRAGAGRLTVFLDAAFTIFFTIVAIVYITPIDLF